jgi:hypothetical protein
MSCCEASEEGDFGSLLRAHAGWRLLGAQGLVLGRHVDGASRPGRERDDDDLPAPPQHRKRAAAASRPSASMSAPSADLVAVQPRMRAPTRAEVHPRVRTTLRLSQPTSDLNAHHAGRDSATVLTVTRSAKSASNLSPVNRLA